MNKSIIAILLISGMSTAFKTSTTVHTVPFKVSTENSKIEWIGTEITKKQHNGTVQIKSGTLQIDHGKIASGKVEVDMTTIKDLDMEEQWAAKLEGHLKSDDFFSVDKYPTATFVITKVEALKAVKDGNNHQVTGNMTIKGITNEISFPANIKIEGNKLAAFANFDIDRTLWEVKFRSGKFFQDLGDKLIKDEVNIKLSIAATAS